MSEEKLMQSFSSRKGPSEHLALQKSSGQFKAAVSRSATAGAKAIKVRDKVSELLLTVLL